MTSVEEIIALLREHYPYLAAEYGVKRIGLFGSYAKGQPSDMSDVDMVVEFERPIGLRFVELAEYLEHLLGRKVDLLTPAGIQGIRIPWVAQNIAERLVSVEAHEQRMAKRHPRSDSSHWRLHGRDDIRCLSGRQPNPGCSYS
mgnify:CR=1 FL=1|jgi:predicted nucleotidyltransferase